MAFPYVAEEGFELGTRGIFNSETDTQSRLEFLSYRHLAKDSRTKAAPYRGAYCMMIDLAKHTADAYVQEDDAFDLSADGTLSCGFYLYVSPDIVMANNDEFRLLTLQSSGPTNEATIAIKYTTAAGLQIGIGESGFGSGTGLSTGVWHHVAADYVIDDGASDDGSITLYLDGANIVTVSSLDQAAIIQAQLGVVGQDAGTTAGVLLFDDLIVDDARVYPHKERWPTEVVLTKSGHAFVGPGTVVSAQLMSGAAADNVLTIYDTDRAITTDPNNIVERLSNALASETLASAAPFKVKRGCYVELAGTNPRALIRLGQVAAYGSDGSVRTLGRAIGAGA